MSNLKADVSMGTLKLCCEPHMDYFTNEGWFTVTEAEAIEMAIDRHGEDGITSVAYCALETWG